MTYASTLCRIACAAVFGALAVVPAHAAVFTVTTTADSGPGSLRRAINEANKTPDQDRILFNLPVSQVQNGGWTINLQSQLPGLTTAIRIVGPGSGKLTLRAAASGFVIFRIYRENGEVPLPNDPGAPNHYFSGLTLRDSNGPGGAVYSLDSKLEFDDVRFVNNVASREAFLLGGGGAVTSFTGIVNFKNCVFNRNVAAAGGAVFLGGPGAGAFTNCIFRENSATGYGISNSGGAIAAQGNITMQNCELEGNAAKSGSAIWIFNGYDTTKNEPYTSSLSLTGSSFKRHHTALGPITVQKIQGTIYNEDADLNISTSVFESNAMDEGGAIYNGTGNVDIRRCTFLLNTAKDGSVLQTRGGSVRLFNSTLYSNPAATGSTIANVAPEGQGEAPETVVANCTLHINALNQDTYEFGVASGSLSLINTIVNTIGAGQLVAEDGGEFTSQGYNVVNIPNNPVTLDGPGDISGQAPKFVTQLPVYNGGPTPTLALKAGSPAINAGSNVVLNSPYSLNVDQRGAARKIGSRVDIGAYETPFSDTPSLKSSANAS